MRIQRDPAFKKAFSKNESKPVSYTMRPFQVILTGTFTAVQGDIWCNVLAALFTVK